MKDPKGQSVPVQVVPLSVDNESVGTSLAVPSVTSLASGDVSESGLLSCTYEPYLVGTHKIHVMFAGLEVDSSPFIVNCVSMGHADRCVITSKSILIDLKFQTNFYISQIKLNLFDLCITS